MKNKVKQLLVLLLLTNFNLSNALGQSRENTHLLDKAAFEQSIEKPNVQLVDVRSQKEFEQATIEGAINIDFLQKDFVENASVLDKEQPVYIFCRSGKRSQMAREKLLQNGFSQVFELDAGYLSWESE